MGGVPKFPRRFLRVIVDTPSGLEVHMHEKGKLLKQYIQHNAAFREGSGGERCVRSRFLRLKPRVFFGNVLRST